jgi:hypothetical protein
MNNSTSQARPTADNIAELVAQNRQAIGNYFQELLPAISGEENWRKRRVVALLSRLRSYRDNRLHELIEFANDLKLAHAAQIMFYEKYQDALFIFPDVADKEIQETAFIDEKILPVLTQLLKGQRC